jgi:hypothetical protein
MGHFGKGQVGVTTRLAASALLLVSCGVSQSGLIGWSESTDGGPERLPQVPAGGVEHVGRRDGGSPPTGMERDAAALPDAPVTEGPAAGAAGTDGTPPAPHSGDGRTDTSPPASGPPASPVAGAEPGHNEPGGSPSSLRVLRARKVKADRITAGVIFARKLDAKTGTIGALADPLPESLLAEELGEDDVKTGELTVDVLYADQVRADAVKITKAHVTAVKIKDTGGAEE